MSDRASDVDPCLDVLGVPEERRAKCCAHILLCVDEALEKVVKAHEQKIGVGKLLHVKSSRFRLPERGGSSILTLGQIAISKMLSPSHAAQSISLYTSFCDFLGNHDVKNSFKGFTSNRFGRKASHAVETLKIMPLLLKFFEEEVDEHDNLLFLAVHAYIRNEWFLNCSRIYADLDAIFIRPFMELLGIDEHKRVRNAERTWEGVRDFMNSKFVELENKRDALLLTGTAVDSLHAAVIAEIVHNVKKQLSVMRYFDDDGDNEMLVSGCPLTNSGCESRNADLDVRLRASGGTTTVQTLSDKAVVKSNAYLEHPGYRPSYLPSILPHPLPSLSYCADFLTLNPSDKALIWRMGRSGEDGKTVRQMLKDFTANVKATKVLGAEARKKKVRNKALRLLKLLEKCKEHGGPVTKKTIKMVDRMSKEEILLEMALLRALGSEAKVKGLVRSSEGKTFFRTFPLPQLRETVRQVVCPTSNVVDSVESLLEGVRFKSSSVKIGARVQKAFLEEHNDGGGEICGTVMHYGTITNLYTQGEEKGLYQIVYDDDDMEQVELHELEFMLCE